MFNAAKVIAYEDEKKGLLSTDYLKSLRAQLNVTHIFIIDKNGNFIRSTNEDPKLIPNLFSFSNKYRQLLNGSAKFKITPIIPPTPEPKPYKFLTIPNHNMNRLIEVGVRIDFIGNILSEALNNDPNVLSLNLYTPDGTPLGTFSKGKVEYKDNKLQFPEITETFIIDKDNLHFFRKVNSTPPRLSMCHNKNFWR
jgi:hypothetical protein